MPQEGESPSLFLLAVSSSPSPASTCRRMITCRKAVRGCSPYNFSDKMITSVALLDLADKNIDTQLIIARDILILKGYSLFTWNQNLIRPPVFYLSTLWVVAFQLNRYILNWFFQWIRVVFWWSVSCGRVEVYGLCTSKILLSWQVQIQVGKKSSVMRPLCASACPGRETWSWNPPGRSVGTSWAN